MRCSMRFSGVALRMMRWTKMPGVWIWSASSSPDLDQLLDLGNRDLAGRRHVRIEVARRHPVDEVAGLVALPGLDQSHVGFQRPLQDVLLPVELRDRLALGHDRAEAGLGIERRNAGAARPQLLRQRSLRREFQFQFAGEILPLEFLVLADIGRDHLLDLARLEQHAEAEAVDAGIVGDGGEVLVRPSRAPQRSALRECRTGRSRRRPKPVRP